MRARNVKPSLFKNEHLAVADPLYTVIFVGLWCAADREGRLEDRPAKIHFEINPGRAVEDTLAALDWLCAHDFIVRYEVESKPFIQIANFQRHQKPHPRESASEIPPCSTSQATPRHGLGNAKAVPSPSSSLIRSSLIPPSPFPLTHSLRSSSSELLSSSSSERADPEAQKALLNREKITKLARTALAKVPT